MNTKLLQTLVAAASFSLCLGAVGAFAAQPAPAKHESSSKMWSEPYMKVGAGVTMYNQFKAKSKSVGGAQYYTYTKKKPSKTPSFHMGVGCHITDDFSTDLTLRYSEIKYKGAGKQDITAFDVMANAYYHLNLHKTVVPYITLGAGFSRNHSGAMTQPTTSALNPTFEQKGAITTNFAWTGGLGVKFNLVKNYAIDLGYRYIDQGKIKVKEAGNYSAATQKLNGHQGVLSLIYKF